LLLAVLGTVLFWVGTVGAVYSVFRSFKPRNIREKPTTPPWQLAISYIVIAMVGYGMIYVSGVG